MKCEIHGNNEQDCKLYSGHDCCITESDTLDSGNFVTDKLYTALDKLYSRGWLDLHKGRHYDPRGTVEWQMVLDLCRVMAKRARDGEKKYATIVSHNSQDERQLMVSWVKLADGETIADALQMLGKDPGRRVVFSGRHDKLLPEQLIGTTSK